MILRKSVNLGNIRHSHIAQHTRRRRRRYSTVQYMVRQVEGCGGPRKDPKPKLDPGSPSPLGFCSSLRTPYQSYPLLVAFASISLDSIHGLSFAR